MTHPFLIIMLTALGDLSLVFTYIQEHNYEVPDELSMQPNPILPRL